jgi:hypothetical protein
MTRNFFESDSSCSDSDDEMETLELFCLAGVLSEITNLVKKVRQIRKQGIITRGDIRNVDNLFETLIKHYKGLNPDSREFCKKEYKTAVKMVITLKARFRHPELFEN